MCIKFMVAPTPEKSSTAMLPNILPPSTTSLLKERYKILRILPGFGAAAVERLEVASGKIHLSVFEFEGNKVSKIIEYWE